MHLTQFQKTKMSKNSQPRTTTNLLSLSLEIRLEIYSYLIPRRQILEAHHPGFNIRKPTGGQLYSHSFKVFEKDTDFHHQTASWRDPRDDPAWDPAHPRNPNARKKYTNATSIFRVCKQISNEALNVLYGDNIFVIRLNNCGEHNLKKNYPRRYRNRMRWLIVIAQHRSVLYGWGSSPDVALWSEMLPHVRGLRIVTKRPVRLGYTRLGKSDEEKIAEWVKWLRPFMQCFKEYLPECSTVIVDDVGKVEEGEIVQQYFPLRR